MTRFWWPSGSSPKPCLRLGPAHYFGSTSEVHEEAEGTAIGVVGGCWRGRISKRSGEATTYINEACFQNGGSFLDKLHRFSFWKLYIVATSDDFLSSFWVVWYEGQASKNGQYISMNVWMPMSWCYVWCLLFQFSDSLTRLQKCIPYTFSETIKPPQMVPNCRI